MIWRFMWASALSSPTSPIRKPPGIAYSQFKKNTIQT
jgi:hypothetical protein